jgi:indolepyruvate ferredoxin oxidoreductase alpha subunit
LDREIVTGNEALALGALRAGVKVITGYPGTPSSEAIGFLLSHPEIWQKNGVHVEWSTNEKVAFEISAGAAWAGQRALVTMKMSGLNVAFDSLISIAYSGINGGLVIYVADDPGVSAGMAEQDSRGFAMISDLPMLEPSSVKETYELSRIAFELSEEAKTPVFLRLTTSISQSHAPVELETPYYIPLERDLILERDINKYTKAGAAICMAQHRDLINRLGKSGEVIKKLGLNELSLSKKEGGLGIIASGAPFSYLEEGLLLTAKFGLDPGEVSILKIASTNPFPEEEARLLLERSGVILVLEELEPYLEKNTLILCQKLGLKKRVIGKMDGTFDRVGDYGLSQVVSGIQKALNLEIPPETFSGIKADELAALRPITVCAGCPHRGTFMAINSAIRKAGFKKDQVMVTGDIGCTILGMNPPFNTVWNEVSMGASIGIAQGFKHAGFTKPVIATIGDSTFFHAGIPPLINAIQYQVPLTVIVMDNGWTAMTGMQFNPGTSEKFLPPGSKRVDLEKLIPGLGVEHFWVVDPYDLPRMTNIIAEALNLEGVKVILSRRECAIQALRRGERAGMVRVIPEKCTLCKSCLTLTGCPALSPGETAMEIDGALCNGCGLCVHTCGYKALEREEI